MKKLFILTALILYVEILFAQNEYSSSVPSAIRTFEEALRFYDARLNEQALELTDKSIKADSTFIEAHMLRAGILTDMRKYEQAISSYLTAIRLSPEGFQNNYFSVGRLEYMVGNYSDARLHLEKFLTMPKASQSLKSKASQLISNSVFAEGAVNNPVPFNPVNMGENINSGNDEYFPAITADNKTFLFTRRVHSQNSSGRSMDQEDFYVSHRNDKNWGMAIPLSEINTSGNEGAPSLSADGQYLFFTACEEKFIMNSRKTNGSCDIFIAKKVGDKYMVPRNLEEPINTGTWESQPSFSSDGRTLYFVRKVKESDNSIQYDIYVSYIGDDSKWSEPVSVGDRINTKSNEMSVFIHPDDQTLYFSSDGHPGMGGQDIFISRREPDGSWGVPVNLGYPINTMHDENSLLVNPQGDIAFIASNRSGGFGGLDLYEFDLYDKIRPIPVTYMKGKVFDAETKKVLAASFELIDLETGKIVVSSSSNQGNGEFIVALPTGKRYALNVSKDGYLFYSENFELKDSKTSNEPYLKDVPLKPIKAGESIVLKNIFYDTDKFDLKQESKIELNKLITFLNKNPKLKFEVSGHTDNVGTKQYNQGLSERRAKAVTDYLSSNGISASRMESTGFGDSKPIADNGTESGRAQNRRTEFKIVATE